MKITEAAVKRLAPITEDERRKFFNENSKFINYGEVIKKSRFLEAMAMNDQLPEVAQQYDDVTGCAAMWDMKSHYPEHVNILS